MTADPMELMLEFSRIGHEYKVKTLTRAPAFLRNVRKELRDIGEKKSQAAGNEIMGALLKYAARAAEE